MKWHHSIPKDAPYSILKVPFWASVDEISVAYSKLMRPDKGDKPTVRKKIEFDKSYRALMNTEKRILINRNINRLFFREINNQINTSVTSCDRCGTDVTNKFCTYCGFKNIEEAEPSCKEWPSELNPIIDTLIDEKLCNSQLKLYEADSFYPCFKYKSDNFHYTITDHTLNTPSLILEIINKCLTTIKESTGYLISSKNKFIIFTNQNADIELINKIMQTYEDTAQNNQFPKITLILKNRDGTLSILYSNDEYVDIRKQFNDHYSLMQFILKI